MVTRNLRLRTIRAFELYKKSDRKSLRSRLSRDFCEMERMKWSAWMSAPCSSTLKCPKFCFTRQNHFDRNSIYCRFIWVLNFASGIMSMTIWQETRHVIFVNVIYDVCIGREWVEVGRERDDGMRVRVNGILITRKMMSEFNSSREGVAMSALHSHKSNKARAEIQITG